MAASAAAVLIALLLTLAPAASAQEATTTSLSGPTTAETLIYVQFKATLTLSSPAPQMPSGSLQLFDGSTPIPDCSYTPPPPAGYQINCTTRFSKPGPHQITARYSGDDDYAGSTSAVLTVNVSPPPPRYANLMAIDVTPRTAKLYALVVVGTQSVRWRFQFGRTTRYGGTTPVHTLPANTKTTSNALAPLRGLKPGTRYHFRVILTTPYVTVTSGDHTFKTPRPPRLHHSSRR
ncbi:MAG TPA: Ig-like domain-containing protein [Solirubrobacteraceae bacterium]|jgi:hypothetical protein